MKEYQILFNAEMVRAYFAGLKSQTRRVLKLPKWSTGNWDDFRLIDGCPEILARPEYCYSSPPHSREIKSPYGQAGDQLWVRETWAVNAHYDYKKPSDLSLGHHSLDLSYIADFDAGKPGYLGKTRPSIFLPRWASRILLPVLDVRVERLQKITQGDVLTEGIPFPDDGMLTQYDPISPVVFHTELKRDWIRLWDSINAKRGHPWASNPWVRVVKFPKYENGKEK